jgi:hypothetical protein
MGFWVKPTWTYNIGNTNVDWFGLPYNFNGMDYDTNTTSNGVMTASDIVCAIEGTTAAYENDYIDTIWVWDGESQGAGDSYFYRENPPTVRGWTGGNNFTINPGDGIALGLSGTISPWSHFEITGTDQNSTQSFTFNVGNTNVNWMSIPYTIADYDYNTTSLNTLTASDIVCAIEGTTGANENVFIDALWIWNSTSQGAGDSYFYRANPPTVRGWTGGNNFTINPGDCIALGLSGNTASFGWDIKLIQYAVPDSRWDDP